MKLLLRSGLLVLFLCSSFPIFGQQYLVVQKLGKVKNFKYEVGDKIMVKTREGEFTVDGEITGLSDTSVTINSYVEVGFRNVAQVLRPRMFFKALSQLFFIQGGIAYTTIVGINGLINNDSPIIDEQTIIISATMVGIGFVMKPFYLRKLNTKEKWKLKVIDFDNIPNLDKPKPNRE